MVPADDRGSKNAGVPMLAELRDRLAAVETKLDALRGHL
jgi:hypothetical protein